MADGTPSFGFARTATQAIARDVTDRRNPGGVDGKHPSLDDTTQQLKDTLGRTLLRRTKSAITYNK